MKLVSQPTHVAAHAPRVLNRDCRRVMRAPSPAGSTRYSTLVVASGAPTRVHVCNNRRGASTSMNSPAPLPGVEDARSTPPAAHLVRSQRLENTLGRRLDFDRGEQEPFREIRHCAWLCDVDHLFSFTKS